MNEHDNILVFCDGQSTYNLQLTDKPKSKIRSPTRMGLSDVYGHQREYNRTIPIGKRVPTTLLEFGSPNHGEGGLHPTQKPVALLKYLVKTYTNPADTVLDFTMGSGTTGVACTLTGRNFIGIEIDADYYAIAERRIREAQQQSNGEFVTIQNDSTHDDLPLFREET